MFFVSDAEAAVTVIGNETGGQEKFNGTYVSQNDDTNNKFSDGYINTQAIAGTGKVAYLRFDLNSIPQGSVVTNATVYLTDFNSVASGTFSIFNITDSGSVFFHEKVITYNNQPCGTPVAFNASCNRTLLDSTTNYNGVNSTTSFDVINAVASIMGASNRTVGFMINNTENSDRAFWNKNNQIPASLKPRIYLEHSPAGVGNGLTISDSSASPSSLGYFDSTFVSTNVTVQNATTNATVGSVYADFFGTNRTMTLIQPFANSSGGGVFNLNFTWTQNATPAAYTIKYYATETVQAPDLNVTDAAQNEAFSVNKATNNTLTLTVTPSASVTEGTTITATGTDEVGSSLALTRDGIGVTNPITTSLGFGTYNFTLVSAGTAVYAATGTHVMVNVGTGGFGCTTPLTFAFNGTIQSNGTRTAADFSNYVDQLLVRADFKDVYLNTTNAAVVGYNFTPSNGNHYLIVNTENVSSFRLDFGNYIGNQTYVAVSQGLNISPVTSSQKNPYYTFNVYDEVTGAKQLPPSSNRTFSVTCSLGSTSFGLNDTNLTVAALEQPSDFRVKIDYGPTDQYFRSLIPNATVEVRNFYLVDALQDTVAEMVISLADFTTGRKFSSSPIMRVTKNLAASAVTMTENRFDAEQKVVIYLVNGDQYTLQVDNGQEVRGVGNLFVETTDLDKTITVTDIISLNQSQGNVSYSLNMTASGTIVFGWNDFGGQIQRVNFTVFNHTSGATLNDQTSTAQTGEFTYLTPDVNQTYRVKVHIAHPVFGQNSWGFETILTSAIKNYLVNAFPDVDKKWFLGAGIAFLVFFAALWNPTNSHIGNVLLVVAGSLLSIWGVIDLGAGAYTGVAILAVGMTLAILGAFVHRRRTDFE